MKEKNKIIIPITIISIIVIALLIISTLFAVLNMNNTKIMKGIYIAGIDVSDLTIEEATEKINQNINNIKNRNLNLKYENDENILNLEEIKAEFNVEKAIIESYSIGRNKNIIKDNYQILWANLFKKNINLEYTINEEETTKKLTDIESNLEGVLIENAYYIENEELVITKGKAGLKINQEETIKNIKENIENQLKGNENNIIEIKAEKAEPKEIDIEKIKNEIYKEPKDAYYEENPFKIYPEVEGVDFAITIEEAKNILKEEKEEYRIPLKITKPETTINDLSETVFPNTLSSFITKYDATAKNRSTNISLVAQAIDGKVVLPGETFSFNSVVGNTTKEKGYKLATAYVNGKSAQDYGGGTCQVSTTLYNALLRANLEIVSRRNHSYIVSYVDIGTDATIAYPTTDLVFKNNRQYAVKISASAKNGILKIEILGIKEDIEYDVEIESEILQVIPYETITTENSQLPEGTQNVIIAGANGYKSKTYKTLILNGEEISRTLISEDTYKPMTREVEIGTKKN